MAPTLPARPATPSPVTPAVMTPPPALPAQVVARPGMAMPPSAKVVAEGRRVFLNLNVAVARAEVYAGTRLLGQLPGGSRLEITSHVPNAVRGELIMHYFDARGTKTVQKIQVGSVRK
jgi:capsular polysaccharide biosynthesis protein